jgi:hypothetical protein
MAVAGSIGSWRERPPTVMAGLGLVSGFASVAWGMSGSPNLEWLQPLATLFGLPPELMPIGFYFGAIIALGVWMWTRSLWAVPVLLITTMYAWSAAVQVAIRLQRNAGDDPHLIAASLGAGAVGAGLTHLGCAVFGPELRRPMRIALTCLVGALAGMLFYLGERKFIDERLLYLVWQPAVAFCIGLGLTGRSQG